jgi:hypothetical protein
MGAKPRSVRGEGPRKKSSARSSNVLGVSFRIAIVGGGVVRRGGDWWVAPAGNVGPGPRSGEETRGEGGVGGGGSSGWVGWTWRGSVMGGGRENTSLASFERLGWDGAEDMVVLRAVGQTFQRQISFVSSCLV